MISRENIIIDSIAVLFSKTIPKDLLSDSAYFPADKWISRLATPFSRTGADQSESGNYSSNLIGRQLNGRLRENRLPSKLANRRHIIVRFY